METVKVKKDELLKILKENRAAHREIFEEASEAFRKEVIKVLDERLADAKAGKRIILRIDLVQPMDQTEEYDQAIRMCEMSVDDEIELSYENFRNYVLDKWHWRDQFIASNAGYSEKARALRR
ncbi:MAG: hypothetical protein ACXAC5_02735 [Promethearchaeota archaeon]|jgi:hypothetical protein